MCSKMFPPLPMSEQRCEIQTEQMQAGPKPPPRSPATPLSSGAAAGMAEAHSTLLSEDNLLAGLRGRPVAREG